MQDPDTRAGIQSAGMTVYPESPPIGRDNLRSNIHLAIGMFDGVHLGHQAVIGQAVTAAKADAGSSSGVLTFSPHPSRVLRPDKATRLLMPLSGRIEQMMSLGLDYVFVQEFSREYAQVEASMFVSDLKSVFPGIKTLHVGANFRFGAGRSGSVDTLIEHASPHGIQVHVLERKSIGGEVISSSSIRNHLAMGEIEQANQMLGYAYKVSGRIVVGKQIGRALGFPTLNIQWCPEALPKFGVYKAWLLGEKENDSQQGVANYGLRPTVSGDTTPLLELHLLHPEYIPETGSIIDVALTKFLRPELTFPTLNHLKEQISRDIESASEIPGGKGAFLKFPR